MASFNRARTRSRTNHPSLSKDEIDQVVDLVLQQNKIIESPEKASKIKDEIISLLTEKIIDPWLDDINRTIGDMVTELEAEKELRSNYEKKCHDFEIQGDILKKKGAESYQQQALLANSKFSKSRLLNLPRNWTAGRCNPDLELEIDILKRKIEQLENVNQELIKQNAFIFYQKEEITKELESLTQALFEEANKMVADESRLRAELEKSNHRLGKALQLSLTRLHDLMYENWSEIWANYGIKLKRTVSWQTPATSSSSAAGGESSHCSGREKVSSSSKGSAALTRTVSETMSYRTDAKKKIRDFIKHFNGKSFENSPVVEASRELCEKKEKRMVGESFISGDLLSALSISKQSQ